MALWHGAGGWGGLLTCRGRWQTGSLPPASRHQPVCLSAATTDPPKQHNQHHPLAPACLPACLPACRTSCSSTLGPLWPCSSSSAPSSAATCGQRTRCTDAHRCVAGWQGGGKAACSWLLHSATSQGHCGRGPHTFRLTFADPAPSHPPPTPPTDAEQHAVPHQRHHQPVWRAWHAGLLLPQGHEAERVCRQDPGDGGGDARHQGRRLDRWVGGVGWVGGMGEGWVGMPACRFAGGTFFHAC